MQLLVEKLQKENDLRKQNEEIYMKKFQLYKDHIERFHTEEESSKALIHKLEYQLSETKAQLKIENNNKLILLNEKDNLVFSLKQV